MSAGDQRHTEQLMLKDSEEDDIERKLRLKGQMIYMDNWRFVENAKMLAKTLLDDILSYAG